MAVTDIKTHPAFSYLRFTGWLLVAALFCAPLFVGLGGTDLKNDEDIYSFAVELMVETGDFLTPRSIPSEAAPFFEKPPLKFWIVAGSIRAGLLPDNEFGHRFWDAVFGALAFLYVFAIGRRLAGPVCGLIAVFVLFLHDPLLMEHGLRSNTMEAALVLSYCGAIFHVLAWSTATRHSSRRLHPIAVAGFFLLGFMTKFVAALFLPFILAAAAVLLPRWRRKALEVWRDWAIAAAIFILLAAPWFIIQTLREGTVFWQVILGEHVYRRMTTSLDASHVHPWHYYLVGVWTQLSANGTAPFVAVGSAALLFKTMREKLEVGTVIVLWFVVPVLAISVATSKLYHYIYPFLPPLALAAGYLPGLLVRRDSVVRRTVATMESRLYESLSSWRVHVRDFRASRALIVVAVGCAAIAGMTAMIGTFEITIAGFRVFRNSSVVRPIIAALASLLVAGHWTLAVRGAAVLLLLFALPVNPYRSVLHELQADRGPMRALRKCLLAEMPPGTGPGVYAHSQDLGTWRYAYYFRRIGWDSRDPRSNGTLAERLWDQRKQAPVLISTDDMAAFENSHMRPVDGVTSPPITSVEVADGHLVLLPGRFGVCGPR
jgi:4-amino-4-deoxy-L-arabinose transferase-like glycosyltransferase